MAESVTERHEQLYHYTTAAGLHGIIESQQLWATNISFLNDPEEQTGFFVRRMPALLSYAIKASIAKMKNTPSGKQILDASGGEVTFQNEMTKRLVDSIRSFVIKHHQPYVISFCSILPQQDPNDGLLSQWRGYGLDGGYAIVFDTNILGILLEAENKIFKYDFGMWGDVEYYDQDTPHKAQYRETIEYERAIKEAICSFLTSDDPNDLDPIHEPIAFLSCLHKHQGFREEAEVRIVALRAENDLSDPENTRRVKTICFANKNGILVPYIKLFECGIDGEKVKLPIKKIIVGPHPDKLRRQKAIQLLLNQHAIDAEVVVSDIPYLGH